MHPNAPPDPNDTVGEKVAAIFKELAGDSADIPFQGMTLAHTIESALQPDLGPETAHEIGFHLADWIEDAAFLVALHLRPDRFTKEEIDAGVGQFLVHAPNHIAAAASLYGFPVDDIFNTQGRQDEPA